MNNPKDTNKPKSCFVIMPIANQEGYDDGHFSRVYEYVIKPAIKTAGFEPIRADEVQQTNYIIIDILKKIVNADMVVCDLSSRNPNVLYELGIRQAFNKPVCLIKDQITNRMFDIQGFRDVEYDHTLRIDKVNEAINELATAIKSTYENKSSDVNSIVQLLGISEAILDKGTDLSPESTLILQAINSMNEKILNLSDMVNSNLKTLPLNAPKPAPKLRLKPTPIPEPTPIPGLILEPIPPIPVQGR